MKKIDSVNNSKAVLGLLSGLKSRITSIMPALYQVITPMLFVVFGLFGVNESAWAGTAKLTLRAIANSSKGGYVMVSESSNASFSGTATDQSKDKTGDTGWLGLSSKQLTLYAYASVKPGCVFLGWAESETGTIISTNTKISYTSGKLYYSQTDSKTYYAIFARMVANTPAAGSTTSFEDTNVGSESGWEQIKIDHAHAGTVSISQDVNAGDFFVGATTGATTELSSFESTSETTRTIYVKFVPQNNGLRTCTLTVGSSVAGIAPLTYVLNGTGYNEPSITWVDGNGSELVSGETTLSAGDVLRATCTTGQTVSYSGFNTSYFTAGTDGDGNPILTVREDISGTINNLSVTANLAKNTSTYYAAYSEAFTLNVTNLTPQEIEWTDDIADLSNENMPYTITLSAVAKNAKTGAASGLPVTYSMASNASLSLSGNVLTVRALGGPVAITASVAGNESYAPASVTKYATVINMTDPCATSDNHSGGTLNRDNKNFDIYPTVPKQLTFRVTKSSSVFLADLEVIQYNASGTQLEKTTIGYSDISTSGTNRSINCNANTTRIRFNAGAYLGYSYTISNVKTTRNTTSSVSVNSLSYSTDPGQSLGKQIKVTYSNIPVFLSFKSDEDAGVSSGKSLWSVNTSYFGGCGKKGSQDVIVTFRSNTKGNYTDKLYVRNNVGDLLHTIDLSASVTAQEQFLKSWNIADAYNTTDQVTLQASTTVDNTDFTFTATTSNPANIVSISNAGVMTFSGSGTATIRAYQPGDAMSQEFETTHNITINKVSPNITTKPTAGELTYLDKLSQSAVAQNGTAKVTLRGEPNSTVTGSWAWTNSNYQVVEKPGKQSYEVTFNPADGGMYTTNTCNVEITVNKADQTLTMNNGTVKVAVGGIDEGADDSKLDLDGLINTQTADVVNAVKRDGVVTYEVISENKANASIVEGNIFSATVIGDYTIRATKAQTDYYNVVTKDFTVTVEKRANTLVTAGPYTKYVDDEVEGVATQVNSDGKIQTSSSDATVAYYDVANNKIVIPNSEAKSFDQKEITIKIWQDATVRFEGIAEADAKTITLTVKKYDNAFSCSWGSWTKRVNFEDVFDVDFTTNNSDFTNSPVVITQTSGETIATLVQNDNIHNTITASYNRGDATWNLSQAENYKYKAATKTGVKVEVRVLPAVDCYLYEDDTEHSFKTAITDISGHFEPAVAISGPVKQISFDAKKDLLGVNYFYAQYSVDNGANWRDIANPDLSSSYETYGPYDFPGLQKNEKVTHIRFGAKTGATEWKYYKNVKVSRTTSIKPEDKDGNLVETLTMPQNTVGGSTTAKFYMNFSSCDDVIKVVSNDSHFTVDQSEITVDHTKDYNYAEVTVTYTSDAKGTHTGTITIYTKYQYRTFTVTGTTDRKVQTLDWKPGFTDNPMILPVGLTVDNVNIAAEAPSGNSVIYSTNNSEVIKITLGGLGFEVVGEGAAELTASAEGDDDVWFPVSETKTVNATGKKIQVILWEQDLMQGLAPEQVIDLTAKVYIRNMQDGSLTLDEERTNQITYSCPDNTAISLNSAAKQITVLDYGQATITANVDGDANYEAALPVTVYVKVRQPSAGCETPLVLDRTVQVQLFSMDMQLSGGFGDWTTPEITSEVILLDAAKGKPDKLSYQHNGELYVYGLIKLCRGTIMAQQRVNGSWSDITGSTYNNEGREGSEGAYDWRLVEDLQLDENADAIRFRRLNAGQGYHNFRNIQITLKQYLRQTNEELDLGDIQIGEARPATIGFDYSDVKGDVWARKANAEDASYVINTSVFEMVCGEHGHKELPITITPTTLGPWSATIIVEDQFTHLPCTLTVKANVVTGISYVFNGSEGEKGTEWGKNTNWENSNTPGTNDAVLVNSDVVITGNVTVGSMTISDEATVTVTVTGKLNLGSKNSALLGNYGNLHIEEGGEVNVGSGALLVNDLILDASLGTTSISAASGQLTDENQKLVLMNKAYFQMSFDPSGQITYGWYDFVVPFEVDIQTGIFREGDTDHHLVPGVDFIVMEHSEKARAAGKKDWSVTTGTMLPGRVYTITFDDEVVQNTFLFQKKQGSDLLASNSYQAVCSAGDSDKRGWNGLGNGTMQHKQMKTAGMKVQLYDHTNNVYVTREADDYIFAVGTSFFIQVGGEQEIEFANATNRTIMAPAREARRTVTEFRLALREEGSEHVADHFWVSASEDATGEYVIGHDLIKMGTPTGSKVAQLWTKNNGLTLCDIEMPLANNGADCELGLYAPEAGMYEAAIERAPEDADLYLTYNGNVIWDLTASPYVFDLAKGTTEGYGLRIAARSPQIATGVDETNADSKSVRKVLINNTIYLITPEGKMYDIVGKSAKY